MNTSEPSHGNQCLKYFQHFDNSLLVLHRFPQVLFSSNDLKSSLLQTKLQILQGTYVRVLRVYCLVFAGQQMQAHSGNAKSTNMRRASSLAPGEFSCCWLKSNTHHTPATRLTYKVAVRSYHKNYQFGGTQNEWRNKNCEFTCHIFG